jgi:stearoyl-CoA desaturase (delta-9 desaturase)
MTNPMPAVSQTSVLEVARDALREVPTTARVAPRVQQSRKLVLINLAAVIVPPLGLVAAIILLWGTAFDWMYLILAASFGLVSAFGITVGFHRLCTHKAFKSPAFVRYALAAAGSMAAQGPVIRWCAEHRRHHQHSDTEGDPHSPHMGVDGSWGEGFWATLRGAYHAHVGWLFVDRSTGLAQYARDLRQDAALVAADRHFGLWVLFGMVAPALIAGLITMSFTGALLGFLWGGLVRVLVVHHITWSVNSICHLWGSRPFNSHDESRNNPIVGVLAIGEGWHNNHHAFPTSARHGLRWWELDISYIFIRSLWLVGLASEIRTPDAERMATKRRAGAADADQDPPLY